MNLISIVVPCYNSAEYIRGTLESIFKQDYENYELLVIDGGSDDGTVEIIKEFQDKIDYWHSNKDKGQSHAISEGFRRSKGNILCWLNSDDEYMPGVLSKVNRQFESCPNLELLYGDYLVMDSEMKLEAKPKISYDFMICLQFYLMIPQPSCFWTRELYESVGGLNTKYQYAFDWDLFLRMGRQLNERPETIKHVHDLYSIFRLHDDSKSVTSPLKFKEERKEIRSQFNEYRNLRFKKFQKLIQVCRTLIRFKKERGFIPLKNDSRKA